MPGYARLRSPALPACLLAGWILLVGHPLPASAAPWTWAGPDGGRVLSLTLQPGSSKVLYAGTHSGVFKTVDGGANWFLSGGALSTSVLAIAVDPAHLSTVYAGLAYRGLIKSTDGGAHWTDAGQGLPDLPGGLSVRALAATAGGVYAGTDLGVYWSVDGGANWQALNQGLPESRSVFSLEINPSQPKRIHAGLNQGLYRSTDGGAHWIPAGDSLFGEVIDVEVSPASSEILYAGTPYGVFRSVDAGDTWLLSQATGSVNALAVHSTLPATVYAASGNGVFKSTDGGATWTGFKQGLTDLGVLALEIDPAAPGTLWAGTSDEFQLGGVFQTTDAAASWTYRSRGLSAGNVYSLAIDPHTPGTLYAALTYQGLARSRDRGLHWNPLPVPQGLILDVEVDPVTPSVVYATSSNGPLLKSADGGDTWTRLGTSPSYMYELEIDPANPAVFYGGADGFYKSTDRGATWVQSPASPDFYAISPTQIEIAPSSPATLYSVVIEEVVGSPPFARNRMFRSTDAGQTWQLLNPGHEPLRIAVSPSDAKTVYAATSGGIFRTKDGGNTWQPVGSQPAGSLLQAVSVAIASGSPETLYAAVSARGVFASTDGGATWKPVGEGLEGFHFTGFLTLDPHDPGRLWTGVEKRGLATLFEPDVCEPGPTTLCLQGGRFRVEAAWTDFQGNAGLGQAMPMTNETGALWFFESGNVELVVKVLDGRGINGRFWVFAASLTSVEFTLTVTDTQTGKQKVYPNPSGKMASFGDTGTF